MATKIAARTAKQSSNGKQSAVKQSAAQSASARMDAMEQALANIAAHITGSSPVVSPDNIAAEIDDIEADLAHNAVKPATLMGRTIKRAPVGFDDLLPFDNTSRKVDVEEKDRDGKVSIVKKTCLLRPETRQVIQPLLPSGVSLYIKIDGKETLLGNAALVASKSGTLQYRMDKAQFPICDADGQFSCDVRTAAGIYLQVASFAKSGK